MVEVPCERWTRVSDGDDDEFHPSPILLDEVRDEGGVLLGLIRVFIVASEVPGVPNLYEDEGACLLSKLVWPGSGVSGTPLHIS